MKTNLRAVEINGSEFTYEGNYDITHTQCFLTTHDLESEDFKKALVNFVNKFVGKVTFESNFIEQESLDIEGVNNLLSKIEWEDDDNTCHSFVCEIIEPKGKNAETLKFIPPNVNVTSINDLKELGIETLDISAMELLTKLLVKSDNQY
jgi:hypothetical protein